MATELKLLGWTSKGLRCPDHSVSFESENGQIVPITLIQMPNGTGKTTVLKLIRAALAGPSIWDETKFDKPIQFRKNTSNKKGSFELELLHNNRRLTISLDFDFGGDGKVDYRTTRRKGLKEGFQPPEDLKQFLKPEFVKLLIFDGELASNLLDSRHTNAQKAIEEMYQLDYFLRMKDRVEEYWGQMVESFGAKGGTRELARRRNRVNKLYERIQEVEKAQKDDEEKLEDIKSEIKRFKKEFDIEIQKNDRDNKEKSEAEKTLSQKKQDLAEIRRKLISEMKNPAELSRKFAKEILLLKSNLDKVKLPGIAAREFFEEIAEQPNCICGREIDNSIAEVILNRKDDYLGSEEVAVLNALKADIRSKVDIETKQFLPELVEKLRNADTQVVIAQNKLDQIIRRAGRNPEIKKINDTIESLSRTQGELEESMNKYQRRDDSDDTWNLTLLKKRYEKAEDDLANTTGTITLKKKKDILQEILDLAFSEAKSALSTKICKVIFRFLISFF
jgi:hypothetical protein